MLHELLLSLSGVPSPIWEDLRDGKQSQHETDISLGSLTSPAEKAMVEKLAELADLHVKVRHVTTTISASHPSPICRAVSNRIKSHHLRSFVDKVIQVEASILDHDAAYVGAYEIVPLSTIVSDFQPWTRPLRWLWKIVQSLQHRRTVSSASTSGADIIRILTSEARTGYTDIEALSEDLLVAAERAWTHNLMPWILYGRLPSFGADDFMIQTEQSGSECCLKKDLVPCFVTTDTAQTILANGLALQQITPRAELRQRTNGMVDTCNSIMLRSIELIKTLQYPLRDVDVSKVAESINDTISQAALSVILPKRTILDLLLVLQDYVLLRNGEFSACLIQQAEAHFTRSQVMSSSTKPVRKLGRLDELRVSEAEVTVILDHTWSELSAFIPEKVSESQLRDRAAELLRLVRPLAPITISTLLPNAASLVVQLPSNSPLSIFISATDIQHYQKLSAYLVSIRRAEFQLTKLWREPSHRRCHPTPIGPPRGATKQGEQSLAVRRKREDRRHTSMRQHWASVNQTLFLITELGSYFQGEVIQKSWDRLYEWLEITTNSRPPSSGLSSSQTKSTRPPTSSSSNPGTNPQPQTSERRSLHKNDPRTIARAHRNYLSALYHSLLLPNTTYTSHLSTLLTTTDHYVALFHRLQTIWSALDLQADNPESLPNAFSNHTQEETEVLSEMQRTNTSITKTIQDLIGAIRDIEEQRDTADLTSGTTNLDIGVGGGVGIDVSDGARGQKAFEPWTAKTLDRLLMKLDSLAGDERSETYEDALVDLEDV